jgi:hypothetical protein
MDNAPSPAIPANSGQPPAAVDLKPRSADTPAPQATAKTQDKKPIRTYRPSHKATFIGLAVVILILAVNAAIFMVVLKKQATNSNLSNKGQISISSEDLNRLGINRTALGSSDVQLIVSPDAQFKNKLSVDGNATIGGQLSLNSKLTGTEASFTQLQAGKTSLSELDVNGNGTLSTLNLRKDLVVAGISQLQGPVTVDQLLTVKNNLVVLGNLSIGGTFSARSLSSSSSLTIGGHIVTSGGTPGVTKGGTALGSNGTVSISGNDAAGVVSINIGAGATSGLLASVSFVNAYGALPVVVISPVGGGGNFYISSISLSSFSIAVSSGLPPGGYRVNFLAAQ